MKAGDAPVALIIPRGFGQNPISFGPAQNGSAIQLLNDASDVIAPQIVMGLLQKVAMTSMPVTMAEQGMKYTGRYIGGLTPDQQKRMETNLNVPARNPEAKASWTLAASSNAWCRRRTHRGPRPRPSLEKTRRIPWFRSMPRPSASCFCSSRPAGLPALCSTKPTPALSIACSARM